MQSGKQHPKSPAMLRLSKITFDYILKFVNICAFSRAHIGKSDKTRFINCYNLTLISSVSSEKYDRS